MGRGCSGSINEVWSFAGDQWDCLGALLGGPDDDAIPSGVVKVFPRNGPKEQDRYLCL